MAEFQSFGEFQKELHEPGAARHSPETPPDSVPPIHRPPRKRSWRKLFLRGAGGLAALACAVLFLPLPVGDVRLHGGETLTREDVLFDGGITEPVNVFQISTSELEDRLRQDVRVADVEVSRSFPAYIDVTVTERKPAAVIQDAMGYAFLDKDGVVTLTSRSIRGLDLPMITGIKLEHALLGDTVRQAAVQTALQFLGGLSPRGAQIFSEINIGNPDNIMAYTRDGIAVRLGDGSSMTARAELAENLVGDVKVRGLAVEYIDASLTSPYIKLKQ